VGVSSCDVLMVFSDNVVFLSGSMMFGFLPKDGGSWWCRQPIN